MNEFEPRSDNEPQWCRCGAHEDDHRQTVICGTPAVVCPDTRDPYEAERDAEMRQE